MGTGKRFPMQLRQHWRDAPASRGSPYAGDAAGRRSKRQREVPEKKVARGRLAKEGLKGDAALTAGAFGGAQWNRGIGIVRGAVAELVVRAGVGVVPVSRGVRIKARWAPGRRHRPQSQEADAVSWYVQGHFRGDGTVREVGMPPQITCRVGGVHGVSNVLHVQGYRRGHRTSVEDHHRRTAVDQHPRIDGKG